MTYKKKDVFRILILRTLGNFFILFTIFGFCATFGPALYFEAAYQVTKYEGIHFVLPKAVAQNTSKSTLLGDLLHRQEAGSSTQSSQSSQQENDTYLGAILSGKKEQVLVPQSTEFSVVIPKIGANEVITPNVDPSNPSAYLPVLQHSVAHAKGSAFPGMNGNIYLFAHSTDNFWDVGRYNAVFYLLTKLQKGDDITIFFQNKRYDYIVYDSKIVDATDVSHIPANIGQGEQLTLQTCWPPGTSWKRFLVFAKPKST